MSFALFFGNNPAARYPVPVGGVVCSAGAVALALDCLQRSRGMMVRQPLARAGSPLAGCDYHAVAAPYRAAFAAAQVSGRGAAGRWVTKQAFCAALAELLETAARASPVQAYAGLCDRAWQAFAADFGYGEAIARAAVALPGFRAARLAATVVRDSDELAVAETLAPVGVGCLVPAA